ncbi:MAG: 2-amino-4-hydroxy-6-hydroxymethyldihydropteridine diphosphokinase [Chlamydiota bacterium]|nr:2-amino-4-hydroxy-6-hydroxymethyldihydropteridine diphosphokinase [Chlamydiota bacterium]
MKKEKIYLGLGGNLGNPIATLKKASLLISQIPEIDNFECSRLYRTSPVSDIPQEDFINGVCSFNTTLQPELLFEKLCEIELKLGKEQKEKNAPRVVDIDILLYGEEVYVKNSLIIPHPRWMERLFVLKPMLDISNKVRVPIEGKVVEINLSEYIENFENIHQETVSVVSEE